jgi:Fur family ferric uptake transcriptional regulator
LTNWSRFLNVSSQPKKKRNSRRRERILEFLQGIEPFLSSQAIHQMLKARGASMGLATVYRQLENLVDEGEVDSILSPSGEKLFRHCGSDGGHQHHNKSKIFGASRASEVEEVEEMAETAAQRYKYSEVSHSLEIFGICESCARKE